MKRSNSSQYGAQSSQSPVTRACTAVKSGVLASILERAQWLAAIDASLRRCLPSGLADHCQLANIDGRKLVMLVNSPVWKSKLRIESERLLATAAALGLNADELVIKVMQSLPSQPTAQSTPLSKTARDTLRTAANSVSDPELRAQLLALASVAQGQPD